MQENRVGVLQDLIALKAGKVKMIADDYALEKKYMGSYTDLTVNQETTILEEMKLKPWKKVVNDLFAEKSPWLYRIIVDSGRTLFLEFLNVNPGGVFLDVGSGWGQISIPLARFGEVVALDLTASRLSILKEIAGQENARLRYVQGNFLTFPFKKESFDLIIFNGSFEWIGLSRPKLTKIKDKQLKALQIASNILKPGGQIYIGIENNIGLKYLFDTPDDHTGIKHISFLSEKLAEIKYKSVYPEDTLPAKTWSLSEYRELFGQSGLEIEREFACFPDYKLIRQMIDLRDLNRFILANGTPSLEHNGINGDAIEKAEVIDSLYRLLAKNGIAEFFCPSYGFILNKRR